MGKTIARWFRQMARGAMVTWILVTLIFLIQQRWWPEVCLPWITVRVGTNFFSDLGVIVGIGIGAAWATIDLVLHGGSKTTKSKGA